MKVIGTTVGARHYKVILTVYVHKEGVPLTKLARAKWGSGTVMYYVYVLKLSNGTYYIGFSSDLKQRLQAHTDGKVSHTKNLRPLELVYYSAFKDKKRALDFEKYLKTNSGFAFRNKRLI